MDICEKSLLMKAVFKLNLEDKHKFKQMINVTNKFYTVLPQTPGKVTLLKDCHHITET
jgi:hypothetical protein